MGGNIFTAMSVIGDRLFSNHPKNINHVHKYSKDLVSVIITMGGNINVVDSVFYDGVKTFDLGSIADVFKILHGRMIFGPFEKFHEGTLWRGHGAVISFIIRKQIVLHLYCRGDRFYNRYINKTDKNVILMMMILSLNQSISYK